MTRLHFDDPMKLHGVVCYWKYNPTDKFKVWELVESYPIDMDGYPLTKVKNAGPAHSRCEWDNWMNQEPEDEDDFPDPIMGRAVTVWTFDGGASLMALHPPEWCAWLSPEFYEKIRSLPNWSSLLTNGFDLHLGTATEAQKVVYAYLSNGSQVHDNP